jgi:hypothetical protein
MKLYDLLFESVKINDSDAIEKMAKIEGSYWISDSAMKDDPHSFKYWKKAYNDIMNSKYVDEIKSGISWKEIAEVIGFKLGDTIYGNGGYNRYKIKNDGFIVFYQVIQPKKIC